MESTNHVKSDGDAKWSQLPGRRQKLKDREAIRRYLDDIDGAQGQLCVLYLNGALDLVRAMKWCSEGAPSLGDETRNILGQGEAIGAEGFILARREPGEEYHPDRRTVLAVSKLRSLSAELDLPLLDYLVFPVGQAVSVGGP